MNYDNYYKDHWMHIMDQLGMNHKPHDCRHTFATMMNNADANKTSIKKIMGHNSYVTTEKIYTHKDLYNSKYYLFENCGALLAFLRPYFFLSFILGSLVKKPAFFNSGLKLSSAFNKALAIPCLIAPA